MSEPLMKIVSGETVDNKQGRSVSVLPGVPRFIIGGSGDVQGYDFDNVSGDYSGRIAYQARYYSGDTAD